MKYLTICDVEIPLVEGPIGVSCSGGADSSLLLYILMANIKEPIHVFTMAKNINFRTSAIVSGNVIEKCIQLTNNINVIHHTVYSEYQNIDNLFEYPTSLFEDKKINWLYTGLTANPPKDISNNFTTPEENTEQESRDADFKKEIFNFHYIRPFININKKTIKNIYQELGLFDTLFPETRSCEHVPDSIGYYEHCGQCWWCHERHWGFGKL